MEKKQETGSSASTKPTKWSLAPYLSFIDNIPQERKYVIISLLRSPILQEMVTG